MSKEEFESPYCPVCGACGEDGCCSAMSCKHSPDGSYCGTYLKELQFGYLMYKAMAKLVWDDPKYKDQIEEIFDKKYDLIWREDFLDS